MGMGRVGVAFRFTGFVVDFEAQVKIAPQLFIDYRV
jgi:hypothetical protein